MIPEDDCVICKGEGFLDDASGHRPCPCRNIPKRDAYAAPSVGWAGEAVAAAMAASAKRQAAQEAHASTCTDRPCKRCERFVCACGKPFEGAKNHRCRECWQAEKRLLALGPMQDSVPKRFRWALSASGIIFERVKATEALIARAQANPPSGDMILHGDTGSGKTSLVVAMLDAWVKQDIDQRAGARFVESYWLSGARARHALGQGEAPPVVAAMTATLLVLDDLGSESDDRRNVISDVIFHRHNEELPTWITTGFSVDQLMARYGSAVIRRIVEHGKVVELGAKK